MNLSNLRSDTINYLEEKHVNYNLYFLFVLIFFVSPNLRLHCNFFYAIIIPIYLVSLRKTKFKDFLGSTIWLIAMALLIYLLLTMFWEENVGRKGHVYYIRKGIYLFAFFSLTMELVSRYPRFIEKLFLFLAWVGAATAVASMIWFIVSPPFPITRLKYIADQLQNSVQGGIVYGMIVLIIYFSIIKNETARSRRRLYGLLMIIIAGSVLLTQSRGPVGALLITFLAGALLTRDKKLLIIFGLIIVVGAVVFLRVPQVQKLVTQRGFSYRVELTQKTIAMAEEDLFFGKGLTTNQQVRADDGRLLYHPHNIYLGIVLYGGLTGLLLFLLLLAAAFRESWRQYFDTKDITFFVLILFCAINMVTSRDKIITHPGPFWFYFWLPLGLLAGLANRRSRAEIPSHELEKT